MAETTESRTWSEQSLWLSLFLMWLAGIDLRLTVLAVPPVLPLIHHALHLDEAGVAALTGLPVLLLAIAAIPGSLLIARLDARRALIIGLLLVTIGSALRGLGSSVAILFFMTFVMGAGIAVCQPALPSLVNQWFPRRVGLATAVYANGLVVSEGLAASLTLPFVLPLVDGSWGLNFVFWSLPVLGTALLFLLLTPKIPAPESGIRRYWWPDWSDRQTWVLGGLQAGCSAAYFGANAFIPDYLHAIGHPGLVSPCLTALNVGQWPGSFVVAFLPGFFVGRRWPLVTTAFLALAGAVGFVTLPTAGMIASAGIIGFAAAFCLVLTLALPPVLATVNNVHRVSAAMFTIGYGLAFFVPLIGGIAWDDTGIPTTAFVPVAFGGLITLISALTLRLPENPGSRETRKTKIKT